MSTPEPPPKAPPTIPIGLGTTLGALGTAVLGVAALVSALLSGDHTPETIGALASAAIVLVATVAGRFAQAYAIYRTRPPSPPIATTSGAGIPTTYLPSPDPADPAAPKPARPTRRRTT